MDRTALTVFISYSRRDAPQADEIVSFLESDGFRVLIDRRDLPFGEEWKSELEYFIAEADCTVWLVSASSIDSQWCAWELEQVRLNRKRLVPVRLEAVAPERLPETIGRVHLLPASGSFALAEHGGLLAQTIRTNQVWIKEHTRLSNAAASWMSADRRRDLLLRGKALSSAEEWRDHQPDTSISPTEVTLDFISSSRSDATRRQRISTLGLLAGLLVAIGLASWALISANNERKARMVAEEQKREAYMAASKALSEESERLFQAGDRRRALDLAVQALPRKEQPDRPYLASAEKALYQAYASPAKPVFFDVPTGSKVTKIHVIEQANTVLLGDDYEFFRPFSMETGKARYPYPSRLDSLNSQPYSVGGSRVAFVDQFDDAAVLLYDVASNKETRFEVGVEYPDIKGFALSRDGRFLAISWADSVSESIRPRLIISVIEVDKDAKIYEADLPSDQDEKPYESANLDFSDQDNVLLVSLGSIIRQKRTIGLDWNNHRFVFDLPLQIEDVLGTVRFSQQLSFAVIHDGDQTSIIDLKSSGRLDGIAGSSSPFNIIVSSDERYIFQGHVRGEGETLLDAPDYDRVNLKTGESTAIDCDCTIIAQWPHSHSLLVWTLDDEFRIINFDGDVERRIGPGASGESTDIDATHAVVLDGADAIVVGGASPRLISLGRAEPVEPMRECVASRDVRWGYTNGTDAIGMVVSSIDDASHCVAKKTGEEWRMLIQKPFDGRAAPFGNAPRTPRQAKLAPGGELGLFEMSVFMGGSYWEYFHAPGFHDLEASLRLSAPTLINETSQIFAISTGDNELLMVGLDTNGSMVARTNLGSVYWYSVSVAANELLTCRAEGLFVQRIADSAVSMMKAVHSEHVDNCIFWDAGALSERYVILVSPDLVLVVLDRSSGDVVHSSRIFGEASPDADFETRDTIQLRFSETGDRLLVNDRNRRAAVLATGSWKLLGTHDLSFEGRFEDRLITLSRDLRFAVVDGYADSIKVSDALPGELVPEFEINIHSDGLRTVPGGFSIHPSAPRLAAVNPSGSGIAIYELENREIVGSADFGKRVVSLDYFDGGAQLAVIAQNGTVDFIPSFASYSQLLDAVHDSQDSSR
ncbi:MAG: toll/interleukin-1 receptor domain-containing protein [Gammaproteobacteria bacterium]|nr:toll/interleukin-1 receptor domain-containing protein [Gammaproteobacteria bacterium]